MSAGMTNQQFNAHLELIAKLIERTATSVEEAAAIVRESKIDAPIEEIHDNALSFDADFLAVPEVRVNRKKK